MKNTFMNSMKLILVSLVVLGACLSCVTAPKKVATNETREFQVHASTSEWIDQKIEVLFFADEELPYFTIQALIPEGSLADPVGEEGLTALTGRLLKFGTRNRSAARLAEDFGQLGSEFSVGVGADYVSASTGSLSTDSDRLMDLFFETLLKPAFKESEVEAQKKWMQTTLNRLKDNSSSLASVAMDRLVFGFDTYGKPESGTEKSLSKLTREKLVTRHQELLTKGPLRLAVVGRFDKAKVLEAIKKNLGSLKIGTSSFMDEAHPRSVAKEKIWLVNQAHVNQVQLRGGHRGILRKDPDYVGARILATILGGGLLSRLGQRLRVEQGLTYSVSANFDVFLKDGAFEIATFTEASQVARVITEVEKELKLFLEQGPQKEELASAKALLKGRFPIFFETAEKTAAQILLLKLYGVPESYIKNFPKLVDNYTAENLTTLARRLIRVEDFKWVAVGPAQATSDMLGLLGPLRVIQPQDVLSLDAPQ